MGYVGNQSTNAYSSLPAKQDLTGATGTSLTLSHAVAGPESIDLFINNVRQEPTTAYSVSDTTVTLTGSVVASDDIYVVYNGLALQTIVPPDGSVTSAKLAAGVGFLSGMLMPYAGASAPTGWEFCYGQSVSTTGTYANLFASIGYIYGGSGSSFNLPDLRGRTIAGQDDMGGSSANRLTSPINGDTLGAAGGAETHSLTVAELPSHNHGVYHHAGAHLPSSNVNGAGGGDSNTKVRGGLTSNTGSTHGHNNVQPTIILNYIIKV